jgi:hypothetical protein
MVKKFGVSRAEVEEGLADGVVPIKGEGVIVSWCSKHFRAAL